MIRLIDLAYSATLSVSTMLVVPSRSEDAPLGSSLQDHSQEIHVDVLGSNEHLDSDLRRSAGDGWAAGNAH